jgi:hypothetical protein
MIAPKNIILDGKATCRHHIRTPIEMVLRNGNDPCSPAKVFIILLLWLSIRKWHAVFSIQILLLFFGPHSFSSDLLMRYGWENGKSLIVLLSLMYHIDNYKKALKKNCRRRLKWAKLNLSWAVLYELSWAVCYELSLTVWYELSWAVWYELHVSWASLTWAKFNGLIWAKLSGLNELSWAVWYVLSWAVWYELSLTVWN